MVYKILKNIDDLYGEVWLGKGCIHIIVQFTGCDEHDVNNSIKEEE